MSSRRIAIVARGVCSLGPSATASAQDRMPGMNMPGHIVIPKGAIYAAAAAAVR